MTPDPPTLEQALAAVERDADAAIESLGACLKAAKAAKAAAASGQMRDLEQALESATSLALGALVEVEDLKDGWRFDVGEWFASGEYAKELLASAAKAGVKAFESDDQILCYPVIVQVSASDATIVVDKKKERRVGRQWSCTTSKPFSSGLRSSSRRRSSKASLLPTTTWSAPGGCGPAPPPGWWTCTGC